MKISIKIKNSYENKYFSLIARIATTNDSNLMTYILKRHRDKVIKQ